MDRRTWLRRSVTTTAGLAAAGGLGTLAHIWVVRGTDVHGLTARGKTLLRHMSRGVLADFLAIHPSQRTALLDRAMISIEAGVAQLPKLVKVQLGGLLGAVDSPATRLIVAGVTRPWADLTDQEVARALDRMRLSNDLPTLVAYKALRSLVCLQVFSDRHLQAALTHYPGPLDI